MKIKLELDINSCLECPFFSSDWINGGKCRWDDTPTSTETVPSDCSLLVKEEKQKTWGDIYKEFCDSHKEFAKGIHDTRPVAVGDKMALQFWMYDGTIYHYIIDKDELVVGEDLYLK